MSEGIANQPRTVADYLEVVNRRKWLILALVVLAAGAAFYFSHAQTPLYSASAEVLVKRTNIVTAVTNVQDPAGFDATRYLKTQAAIARAPELADRVAAAAGIPGLSAGEVLHATGVSPQTDADLLVVTASLREPRLAVQLVNTYADELAKYRTELDTAAINNAITSLRERERALVRRGAANSGAYGTLIQYEGELESVGRQLANNTKVLRPAGSSRKVRPRTNRNVVLGGLFGALVGLAFAFLAEALDRRVRNEKEIEDVLGIPLLARIPRPSRRMRKHDDLVLLTQPESVDAEILRKLRTSFEFVNLDEQARTILVTSAVQQEGKSTTLANLAVALARAGRRVVLVDMDLRRPALHRFFRAGSRPGISDVVVGRADLSDALRPIALATDHSPARRQNAKNGASANGKPGVVGVLHLLPAGTLPPSASEFIEREGVDKVLAELASDFDYVLVDAPPLLAFGDAMSLSAKADAIFAVVRVNVVQRPVLHELARQLRNCRATPLGYIVTGVGRGDAYKYGYEAYRYEARPVAEHSEQRD